MRIGGRWVHLRLCTHCGHVGYCDNSPNRHATAHGHQHRDGCVASRARGAAPRGATAEEAAEALGGVVLMNGGPGTVHAPRAFAAFRFADQ